MDNQRHFVQTRRFPGIISPLADRALPQVTWHRHQKIEGV